MKFKITLLCCIASLVLLGCGAEEHNVTIAGNAKSATRIASAAFPEGCPSGGQVTAAPITHPDFALHGPNAIGGQGDFMLANDQALFVISGVGPQKTYYHYGGILVDAVAVENCQQAVEEEFYEMALMMGRLNAAQQSKSTFRAFNASRIEVINDGSDGEAAVVRATGVDDVYWLLELELMSRGLLDGLPKFRSEPFGFHVEVDYILEPDSPTLKVAYRIRNKLDSFNSLSIAFVLLASGEATPLKTFSAFDMDVEGLSLQYGIPWVTASAGKGAYVYGANSRMLTTTHIAGVDALLDAQQMGNTWFGNFLFPAGHRLDTMTREFFVTVSPGDELAAVNSHIASTPQNFKTVPTEVTGRVVDQHTGAPIAGARIEFQTRKQVFLGRWPWETFVTTYSDEQGRFGGSIPLVSYLDWQTYRMVVSVEGRPDVEPIFVRPNQPLSVTVEVPSAGTVAYDIRDEQGNPLPAMVAFFQNGKMVHRTYTVAGKGTIQRPPGDYEVSVSRGFEYGIVRQPLTVAADTTSVLQANLVRMVDTSGYLSMDAHVHSSPSPDSSVSPQTRIVTGAASGLEVMVATDHEIWTDLSPSVRALGVEEHIATVIGQEVTASMPNHTIAYPFPRDPKERREFVPWHGKDIAEIFAMEKAMGAQIRTFAHPRGSYLDLIQWDRIAGKPGNVNPRHLGLADDATLWSWDFEAMEYMNGKQKVFSSGSFEDWMSFLNHGHRITATGASDIHSMGMPGIPRTYFRSPTDKPAEFQDDYVVAAIQQGQAVVSMGAFARVLANGKASMGDTLTDTDGQLNLALKVEAIPDIDVDHVRVYVNCDEVARLTTANPADSAVKLDQTVQIPLPGDRDAHVVVLGFGVNELPAEFPSFDPTEVPRFTTNAVYVDTQGDGQFTAPGGKACQF